MNRTRRSNWRLDLLAFSAIGVLAFNRFEFVGCRCWYGQWERFEGLAADTLVALVVIRFLAAWLAAEKNDGWKYYIVLLLTCPFLVQIAFAIARLALPPELRVHPQEG